jgi:excisionase family DNA binding protein
VTEKNEGSVKRLLLRPREVADLIGISRSTAYELINSGQIPSLRIGGMLRVPAAGLEEMIADKLAGAEATK